MESQAIFGVKGEIIATFQLLRCSPFVLDATKGDWESEVPFAEESLDCVLLIFTMVTRRCIRLFDMVVGSCWGEALYQTVEYRRYTY